MVFLCSWPDSWTHRARLRGCDSVWVCSLTTILFTKTGVTVLHVQFNYKRGRLFQAWHFKSEACHHSWSCSCLWERERTAWYWLVYTTGRERGTEIQFTWKLNQLFFLFVTLQQGAQKFFFQIKYFMSVSRGNDKLSLNRSRSCYCCCCCATFAQEVWVSLCHYSCTTPTGAIRLWLAFWFETWDSTHRKKNISSLWRTGSETHLVFQDRFGFGVRSVLVLFLGKPPLLTSGLSTTCQRLLRMSDLCSQHLLPPQSPSALSSHCAPCVVFPKPQSNKWQWHPSYAVCGRFSMHCRKVYRRWLWPYENIVFFFLNHQLVLCKKV